MFLGDDSKQPKLYFYHTIIAPADNILTEICALTIQWEAVGSLTKYTYTRMLFFDIAPFGLTIRGMDSAGFALLPLCTCCISVCSIGWQTQLFKGIKLRPNILTGWRTSTNCVKTREMVGETRLNVDNYMSLGNMYHASANTSREGSLLPGVYLVKRLVAFQLALTQPTIKETFVAKLQLMSQNLQWISVTDNCSYVSETSRKPRSSWANKRRQQVCYLSGAATS